MTRIQLQAEVVAKMLQSYQSTLDTISKKLKACTLPDNYRCTLEDMRETRYNIEKLNINNMLLKSLESVHEEVTYLNELYATEYMLQNEKLVECLQEKNV